MAKLKQSILVCGVTVFGIGIHLNYINYLLTNYYLTWDEGCTCRPERSHNQKKQKTKEGGQKKIRYYKK